MRFVLTGWRGLERTASFVVAVVASAVAAGAGEVFGVVGRQFGEAGGLAQLGVASGLGVADVQVDAGDVARVPLFGGGGPAGGNAYGEEAEVTEADGLAVEHQLFQAGEPVDEDTVNDAARVGRVVLGDVGDEIFKFHRAVLHGAGIPLGRLLRLLRLLGRIASVLQCSDC